MSALQRTTTGRDKQLQARAGSTLVELIIVLLIAAILSGLAVPSLSGLGRAKTFVARTQVRSFLVFAQEWAIGTGRPTWVGYDASSKQLLAFQARKDNDSYAWRVALPDPLTREQLSVDLSQLFRDEDFITSAYGSFPPVRFSQTGTPAEAQGEPRSADTLIPLAEDIGVLIHADSGLISVY